MTRRHSSAAPGSARNGDRHGAGGRSLSATLRATGTADEAWRLRCYGLLVQHVDIARSYAIASEHQYESIHLRFIEEYLAKVSQQAPARSGAAERRGGTTENL